jgi:predicted nucleic acid-binding protein
VLFLGTHAWLADARAGPITMPPTIVPVIAATAIHHGQRLITRNTPGFEPTGLLIVNLWDNA